MDYRILGRTGRAVSVISLGTWQLGGDWVPTPVQSLYDEYFRIALADKW